MFDSKEYWEHCFTGLDDGTYDMSTTKPAEACAAFCDRFLEHGSKVLDLGCGVCNNAQYMAQRGLDVYGVDFAPKAIVFCRRRFDALALPGDFREGSLADIPFPDDFFDGVVCLAALDHVTLATAIASCEEIKRVLKVNGVVLLTFAPCQADQEIIDEAELLPDGTMKFIRGIQRGLLFRQYSDREIRHLLRGFVIAEFNHTEHGTRIIIARQ
jgi:cyclopropane fatty-acyl-phospholipid synthase-like methyltransferase